MTQLPSQEIPGKTAILEDADSSSSRAAGGNVEQLWAPWRLSYASTPRPTQTEGEPSCFICRGLGLPQSSDRENLIVGRFACCVVVLNRFPYNNGHLLVAPSRHIARLDEHSSQESAEIQTVLGRLVPYLESKMNADGFNIGLNLGRAAGAGLPGHLHWHLVPRWNGDTNFMPILTDTKVIVQSLDSLYDLLAPELATWTV